MLKRILSLILALAIIACVSGCAQSAPAEPEAQIPVLDDVAPDKDNRYTCSFEGVKHAFITDLPDKTEGAPLVLMLHGYGDSAEGMRGTVHFEEQANPAGYAVVYVNGATDPNDPTSAPGWNSGISAGGNNDLDFLTALVGYLCDQYGFDKTRVYAAGFSNGAFMTHRLAMDAGGTFAAVVSVAGKMPQSVWDRRNEKNDVGFFQITGEKDEVVPKNSDGSAKYAKDPAIEDVMAYWAASDGLELAEQREIGKGSTLSVYRGGDSAVQVWDLSVKNAHHSWPPESIYGIDTNALILEFFEAQKPAPASGS